MRSTGACSTVSPRAWARGKDAEEEFPTAFPGATRPGYIEPMRQPACYPFRPRAVWCSRGILPRSQGPKPFLRSLPAIRNLVPLTPFGPRKTGFGTNSCAPGLVPLPVSSAARKTLKTPENTRKSRYLAPKRLPQRPPTPPDAPTRRTQKSGIAAQPGLRLNDRTLIRTNVPSRSTHNPSPPWTSNKSNRSSI